MALPDAAAAYYVAQQRVSLTTLALTRRLWAKLGKGDFDQAWRSLGPQLLVVLSAGQRAAVSQAVAYVPAVLGELNISADAVAEVAPGSLVGVASDGRQLASLLYQPVIQTRTALGQGKSLSDALRSGGGLLDDIVTTQTADAGRAAESVATVVRPAATGYVRMLVGPSCPRCVVLAGKHSRWQQAFLRHPQCNCRNIPCSESVAADITTDPVAAVRAGQVHGLSKADTQAILDGADPAKVINAHRGMSTEQVFGQRLKVTAASAKRGQIRLRPESIYAISNGDRAEALRLLKVHGYVL